MLVRYEDLEERGGVPSGAGLMGAQPVGNGLQGQVGVQAALEKALRGQGGL